MRRSITRACGLLLAALALPVLAAAPGDRREGQLVAARSWPRRR